MTKVTYSFSDDTILYDGTQIRAGWAKEIRGIDGDSIMVFRGPMRVHVAQMIDRADVEREGGITDYPITGDDALHFVVEHHDTTDPNMIYLRQRLLVFIARETLARYSDQEIHREHSDLYVGKRKLSVSIATVGSRSAKIHLGLNVVSSGVPDYVSAIGLSEIGIQEEQLRKIADETAASYISELEIIERDVKKSKRLD